MDWNEQLVGKERDGDYRDVQLYRVFIVWIEMNS